MEIYYEEMENRKIGESISDEELEKTLNVLLYYVKMGIEYSSDYRDKEENKLRELIENLKSIESFYMYLVGDMEINEYDDIMFHEAIFTLKHEAVEKLEEIYHQELLRLIE